jgi:hypothetical protein
MPRYPNFVAAGTVAQRAALAAELGLRSACSLLSSHRCQALSRAGHLAEIQALRHGNYRPDVRALATAQLGAASAAKLPGVAGHPAESRAAWDRMVSAVKSHAEATSNELMSVLGLAATGRSAPLSSFASPADAYAVAAQLLAAVPKTTSESVERQKHSILSQLPGPTVR